MGNINDLGFGNSDLRDLGFRISDLRDFEFWISDLGLFRMKILLFLFPIQYKLKGGLKIGPDRDEKKDQGICQRNNSTMPKVT